MQNIEKIFNWSQLKHADYLYALQVLYRLYSNDVIVMKHDDFLKKVKEQKENFAQFLSENEKAFFIQESDPYEAYNILLKLEDIIHNYIIYNSYTSNLDISIDMIIMFEILKKRIEDYFSI